MTLTHSFTYHRRYTYSPTNAVVTFRKVQIGTGYKYDQLRALQINTWQSTLNPNSNTAEPYRPQRDRPPTVLSPRSILPTPSSLSFAQGKNPASALKLSFYLIFLLFQNCVTLYSVVDTPPPKKKANGQQVSITQYTQTCYGKCGPSEGGTGRLLRSAMDSPTHHVPQNLLRPNDLLPLTD